MLISRAGYMCVNLFLIAGPQYISRRLGTKKRHQSRFSVVVFLNIDRYIGVDFDVDQKIVAQRGGSRRLRRRHRRAIQRRRTAGRSSASIVGRRRIFPVIAAVVVVGVGAHRCRPLQEFTNPVYYQVNDAQVSEFTIEGFLCEQFPGLSSSSYSQSKCAAFATATARFPADLRFMYCDSTHQCENCATPLMPASFP
uniref:Uncharacterized protein n=1 Tax=Romanomermis culicivorax TaxID=13658 RepID=A0A915KVL5_ROMCU